MSEHIKQIFAVYFSLENLVLVSNMEVPTDGNEVNAAAGPANDRLNQERMLEGLKKAVNDALNKNQTTVFFVGNDYVNFEVFYHQ